MHTSLLTLIVSYGRGEINFEMLWNALLKEVGFKVGFEESTVLQKLTMG